MYKLSGNNWRQTNLYPQFSAKPKKVKPFFPLANLSDEHIQEITVNISRVFTEPEFVDLRDNKSLAKYSVLDRLERLKKKYGEAFVRQYMGAIKRTNATAAHVELVKDGVLQPSRAFRRANSPTTTEVPGSLVSLSDKASEIEGDSGDDIVMDSIEEEPSLDEIIVKTGKKAPKISPLKKGQGQASYASLSTVRNTALKSCNERKNWYLGMPLPDGTRRLFSPFKLNSKKRTIRNRRGQKVPNPPTDAQLTNQDLTHSKTRSRAGTPETPFILPNGRQIQYEDPKTHTMVVEKRQFPKK